MKRSKILILSSLCLIEIFFAILSFILQWKISEFDKNINTFSEKISQTDVEIKMLKTEISYLTSISKVKELSNKYLQNYRNISPNDFIRVIDIPVNPQFE